MEMLPVLTQEVVLAKVELEAKSTGTKEWEETHDFWHGDTSRYKNAPNGYDVNIIGNEYDGNLKDGEYKAIVTHLEKDEDGDIVMSNREIFSFIISADGQAI